jgi:dTDP-glucose 4,6-dehydratase
MTRVLLTGAAGFVGSHVLRHLLVNTDADIVCPVTFRHKGVPPRLHSAIDSVPDGLRRVTTVMLDLTAPIDSVTEAMIGDIDVIMNVASESHVDRSITDPGPFIENNVRLITNVLDYARRVKPRMVLQMSTDEVYGPAYGDHRHTEWETIAPSNPYSASKAAQEAVCFSYWRTYGVPVVITNTMNIIGELQDPEKFVPKTIRAIRDGRPVTVHCAPDGTPGSRFYLHARNLADAWLHLAHTHQPQMYPEHTLPSRFNIVGEREVDNVTMVELIAAAMDAPYPRIERVNFHASRPGHDLRYALDGSKLAATGWKAPIPFEDSLRRAVRWTLDHPEWLAV